MNYRKTQKLKRLFQKYSNFVIIFEAFSKDLSPLMMMKIKQHMNLLLNNFLLWQRFLFTFLFLLFIFYVYYSND